MSKLKKTRWEENEISPSKYRSPTRYAESQSIDYGDKDDPVWNKSESRLTDEQLDVYLQCTRHLKKDIALSILRDLDYDITSAVEKCNGIEEIPDLSLLEIKVLLAAAPVPCSSLGVKSKSSTASEKQVLDLLPHVPPSTIRNYYHRIGRESCIPPRGWIPRVGHILMPSHDRLVGAGLISHDDDSPLYEKPGKRVLRSSTITPELNAMPKKIGKTNNLAIAMVGYDQNKSGEDDSSRPLIRTLVPTRRNSFTIPSTLIDTQSRDSQPKKGRNGPSKTLPVSRSLFRSPLGPSSRPSSPTQIPSPSPSPSPSTNGISIMGKKRKDPLEIDMNWSPSPNGVRMRRPSMILMENGSATKKDKEDKIDSNGKDEQSTSKFPSGSKSNGSIHPSSSSHSTFVSPLERKKTRSSTDSVFEATNSTTMSPVSFSKSSRSSLRIDMVGYDQNPTNSPRDRDGFVIPSLRRSPIKSSTRSGPFPSPSPPASPEI